MSIDYNRIIFGGRLVNDPEELGSGKGCKFDMASNRRYKDSSGEQREETTFVPVTCWAQLGKVVMGRSRKGDAVLVEGRLEVRKFEDAEGNRRSYTNIVATDVRFISSRPVKESADVEDKAREILEALMAKK